MAAQTLLKAGYDVHRMEIAHRFGAPMNWWRKGAKRAATPRESRKAAFRSGLHDCEAIPPRSNSVLWGERPG